MADEMELKKILNYFEKIIKEDKLKIKNLQNKINDLETRQCVSSKKHIKLSDRLIQHHKYITIEEYKYIYGNMELVNNDRLLKFKHPDNRVFVGFLLLLSKQISREMKNCKKKYPNITRKGRSNLYTKEDYEQFIDEVISEYISKRPLSSLNIDWEYKHTDEYDQ